MEADGTFAFYLPTPHPGHLTDKASLRMELTCTKPSLFHTEEPAFISLRPSV